MSGVGYFGYKWVCPADLTSWAVESGREVCRVRKSPAYHRIDREVCVERSGDRGWSPSGRCWGLRTSPGRSVSPFLVTGDTRPFWVTEQLWLGYRTGKTSRAVLCGCAVARLSGCLGETIYTVVYDYDENYVCAGINAASQEMFSTCKPFGVIA